jgi:hypothetical protein
MAAVDVQAVASQFASWSRAAATRWCASQIPFGSPVELLEVCLAVLDLLAPAVDVDKIFSRSSGVMSTPASLSSSS